MKPKIKIETNALLKMIQTEKRAEYARYKFEIESPLSSICDSGDALGPLVLAEKLGFSRWRLSGEFFYCRFRAGERVEIRAQKPNADISVQFSDGWKVETIKYPAPGKIELIVSGEKPLDDDQVKEIFLFKSSSSSFKNMFIKKIREMPSSDATILLGRGKYDLAVKNPQFVELYEKLNDVQKSAIHYLVGNNLSGAVQGPPGTGKTHLLQTVISLALHSDMRVCVASFTHSAVDNLLGKIVGDDFKHEWARVGDSGRVRKELYQKNTENINFISPSFKMEESDPKLVGSTLHKLALGNNSLKFDLLVIDEAGQVPLFFWPFIQRMANRLVLVGDQFQMPPVLSSRQETLPFDNVFSLCISDETPMLEIQYRMRREIQAWSSEKFYKGKLIPHVSVANRDYFSHSPAFLTDGFVVPKQFVSDSSGKYSKKEADFIADKIDKLIKGKENINNVGVICPYRAQAGVVNAALQNRFGVDVASKILVDTVERFQGQEKEAIFLSFGSAGKSQEDLRFLSDPRRLNVSVTRAKSRFYCLYNADLFENSYGAQSRDLNEFLRWVRHGKTYIKKAA